MTARRATTAFIILLASISVSAAPPVVDDGPTATVLCYHIVEAPSAPRMKIDRETFRQHLRYLEMTGYNVIPLKHLYEFVAGKRASIPKNAVVITIDDGWRSTYTEAWPELKKRNFPFTVFVYPNIIGKTSNALTWAQIKEMSDDGVDIQSHALTHPFLTKRRHRSMSDEKYGTNPLKMKRFVIDDQMDFAAFRRYLGARPMQLTEMTPKPGMPAAPQMTTVTARIPKIDSIDPRSVGMALLSLGRTVPYAYDARTGEITLQLEQELGDLKTKTHRAIVWARDRTTGKRVEATWVFRLPQPATEPTLQQPGVVLAARTPPAAPPVVVGTAPVAGGGAHKR